MNLTLFDRIIWIDVDLWTLPVNNTQYVEKILTLFPLGGGHGVSLHIQIIIFQIWIELHGWILYDNIISSLLQIWEEWVS